uniref:Spermatogenesis associated serine rich 2 n=1 Tax=Sphaeramia orbicularis TaxID=375764 RepID=A0A673CTV6_9TELE
MNKRVYVNVSWFHDTSGVVFDTRSKMVMSQGGTAERMKEKISAVRAVVPNKSNNEIVLVLQHFENCVDKAVQAFLEGKRTSQCHCKYFNIHQPKKKKKPKPQAEASAEPAPPEAIQESKDEINGFHANGSVMDGESLDSLSEQLDSASLDAAELDSEPASSETTGNHSSDLKTIMKYRKPANVMSNMYISAPNIDRSVKDLQRCTASLTRYRMVVKEEMDSSIKRMKQTFAELQSCLMDREVTLLGEMDKVKAEAMMILDARQKRAEELRRLTDQSASMSEEQLTELRADIKHFVSERKYDEDLGKAVRFTFDLEPMKTSISAFGSVYHPRTGYSNRSRCSSTSSSVTRHTSVPALTDFSFSPQIFQGNRRTFQGQGYHSGGQRYNGSSYHDRNAGRGNYRNQSDSGYSGPSSQHSNNSRGPAHPDRAPHHNGLPQRPPRTHCP